MIDDRYGVHALLGKGQAASNRLQFSVRKEPVVIGAAPTEPVALFVESQTRRDDQINVFKRHRNTGYRIPHSRSSGRKSRLKRGDLNGDHMSLLPGNLRDRDDFTKLPGLQDRLGCIHFMRKRQKHHDRRGLLKRLRRNQVPAGFPTPFIPLLLGDRQQAI